MLTLSMNIHNLIRLNAFQRNLLRVQLVSFRYLKIKIEPPRKKETHGTKNRRLGRFFAPSLTVYRPQLTSVLSISNRASSLLVTMYTWGLGIGALISSHDNAHFVTMLDGLQMSSASLFILKFMIAFPFAYHCCASVRVLTWETGNFLSLKGIYLTGYIAIAATILTAAGLASL
ncbi:succinate dehydrogenase cytochrome b556 subunit-like [Rhagoletis pomonella]|uniref:succinate dehydrogenase cytochrome b556 subunit-like n=1 Tax=Rhagoletis pomonella TaxID=28610 RepID=UPI001784379D|nr:succinate dehydrogenase cytochrome b556 subunit-like [Rhagoletis pomonella]